MESFKPEPEQEKGLSSELESEKKEYNFGAIAKLEKPIIELAEKLREKIENGEYDTLISDDVGGRIPTLILRKIMLSKAKDDQFKKRLKTFFIAGGKGRHEDEKELGDFIKGVSEISNKVLLVTEYIETGKAIKEIMRLFENYGLKSFDVASVTVYSEFIADPTAVGFSEFLSSFKKNSREFFYGEIVDETPPIYGWGASLGGVKKKTKERFEKREIHGAHPIRMEDLALQVYHAQQRYKTSKEVSRIKEIRKEIREDIKGAREDVEVLSQKVIEQVWK